MADSRDGKSFWHTLPGVLTAAGGLLSAVTGLLVTLHQLGLIGAGGEPPSVRQVDEAPVQPAVAGAPKPSPALEAPPLSPIQIAGRWEDDEGTVYDIVQDGDSFTFTGSNPSSAARSEGSGRLSGRSFTASFVVNGSYTGRGRGDISEDGRRMWGEFEDQLSGSYRLTFRRR